MAKRISTMKKKHRKDVATAYAAGLAPKGHKVALARSKKHRKKNANHAT
jgi:hypothetical protein